MNAPQEILRTDAIQIAADRTTGCVISFQLHGEEILNLDAERRELGVNGQLLDLRVLTHPFANLGDYPSAGPRVDEVRAMRLRFCHADGGFVARKLPGTYVLTCDPPRPSEPMTGRTP